MSASRKAPGAARKPVARASEAGPPTDEPDAPGAASPASAGAGSAGAERGAEDDRAEDDRAEDDRAELEPPMNRAERRARGKGGRPAPAYGRGKSVAGKAPAQGPRMWANRRSG